jgi:hypothetical protein
VFDATVSALRARGFDVREADDLDAARAIVGELVPPRSEVHTGPSVTLEESGIRALLEDSGRYDAVRPRTRSMDRATEGREIRRLSEAPDIMVGSVHAVTRTGSFVTASASGSQLAPYASGAARVIWVIGSQKIVPDLAAAFRRIEEFAFPLEDARSWKAYGEPSAINQVLIVNGEEEPRITAILVRQAVGF